MSSINTNATIKLPCGTVVPPREECRGKDGKLSGSQLVKLCLKYGVDTMNGPDSKYPGTTASKGELWDRLYLKIVVGESVPAPVPSTPPVSAPAPKPAPTPSAPAQKTEPAPVPSTPPAPKVAPQSSKTVVNPLSGIPMLAAVELIVAVYGTDIAKLEELADAVDRAMEKQVERLAKASKPVAPPPVSVPPAPQASKPAPAPSTPPVVIVNTPNTPTAKNFAEADRKMGLNTEWVKLSMDKRQACWALAMASNKPVWEVFRLEGPQSAAMHQRYAKEVGEILAHAFGAKTAPKQEPKPVAKPEPKPASDVQTVKFPTPTKGKWGCTGTTKAGNPCNRQCKAGHDKCPGCMKKVNAPAVQQEAAKTVAAVQPESAPKFDASALTAEQVMEVLQRCGKNTLIVALAEKLNMSAANITAALELAK